MKYHFHHNNKRRLCSVMVALLCLSIFPFSTLRGDVRVSDASNNSIRPGGYYSGNTVYAVWQDNRNTSGGEIYFCKSVDNGSNWGSNVCVANEAADYKTNPNIVRTTNGRLHVVFNYDPSGGGNPTYPAYKYSDDDGSNWTGFTQLDNTYTIPSPLQATAVAASGNYVHVAWYSGKTGSEGIYYKRNSSGSWGSTTQLYSGSGQEDPDMCASGSNVYLVWGDYNDAIYFKQSADNGSSWGATQQVHSNSGNCYFPQVAVNSSGVHVIWTNGNGDAIYHRCYSGGSWGNVHTFSLSEQTDWSSDLPSLDLVCNDTWLYVAYMTGSGRCRYIASADQGSTWKDSTCCDGNAQVWSSYRISAPGIKSNNEFILLWTDGRGKRSAEIYCNNAASIGIRETASSPLNSSMRILPNPGERFYIFFGNITGLGKLEIYDVEGKLVRSFGPISPNETPIFWDGKDELGKESPAGVYLLRLKTDNSFTTGKIIKLK